MPNIKKPTLPAQLRIGKTGYIEGLTKELSEEIVRRYNCHEKSLVAMKQGKYVLGNLASVSETNRNHLDQSLELLKEAIKEAEPQFPITPGGHGFEGENEE